MRKSNRNANHTPLVHGEYNEKGYDLWVSGEMVYAAGNHAHDSTQYAQCKENRLPLKTLRRLCIKTAKEIAVERGGRFCGVERVN